jgi:polysaccharide export outer membrane protein
VYGESDLTLELQVDRDGRVTVAHIGTQTIGGLTSDEIAAHIEAELRQGFLVDPKVAVRIIEHRSRPFTVVSGVKDAGIYFMTGRTSVLEAIAMAGGSPENSTRARVLRTASNVQEIIFLDLQAIADGTSKMFYMAAQDQLYVLEPEVVFVTGQVKEEGAVLWLEGMTAYQALTRAGGPNSIARLRAAYVLRAGETLKIDLKAVNKGRQADLLLMPGDQLVIPESIF